MKRKGGSVRKPQAIVYGGVPFGTIPVGAAGTAFASKMWELIDPIPTTALREEP
jgi:hypothetical protein